MDRSHSATTEPTRLVAIQSGADSRPGRRFTIALAAAVAIGCLMPAKPSVAQRLRGGSVQVEAIAGRPFGVARITIPRGDFADPYSVEVGVRDAQGRIHYPAFTRGLLRRILGDNRGRDAEGLTTYFLFSGDDPLEVTLFAPQPVPVVVRPTSAPARQYRRLLNQWWREWNATARIQQESGDYPPYLQLYLTSMLSRRLGLEPPIVTRLQAPETSPGQEALEMLLGVEAFRAATLRERTLDGSAGVERADLPLPAPIAWPPLTLPSESGEVEVEPIAYAVPAESFYIRFGSYNNYLWFQDLMQRFGGDIGGMVTRRGYQSDLAAKMQDQLALRQSALSRLLGDRAIADMALIGYDLYLEDGAALGVLFEARNNLLGGDLQRQRERVLAEYADEGARLEPWSWGEYEGTLLSTPDNRVRSFYVTHGAFHLVTTSETLARRFLQACDGEGCLGHAAEFRNARSQLPASVEDTLFAYFSSEFFRNLAGPQYQIELARRMQAGADLVLWPLARQAALAEGRPADSVEDLVRGGFLPAGWTRRADGSGPLVVDGRYLDSRRGARGYFLPVADATVESVTRTEATRFQTYAAWQRENWPQLDPLVARVRRQPLGGNLERLVVDARVTPFEPEKVDWLVSILGPPTNQRVRPGPGHVITAQAGLRGGLLFPDVPPHLMFLGILDQEPLTDLEFDGFFKTLQVLQTTPGYLGAVPKPGFLDVLPFDLGGGPPDPRGFSRLPFGLWRWQSDGFSVLSFDRPILEAFAAEAVVEETDDPAHLHVWVDNLPATRFSRWVNVMAYHRAYQASRGNAQLLHALQTQLKVPPESSRALAESLVDAELVCTLGGRYQLEAGPGGLPRWTSTAWPPGGLPAAEEYQAPLLDWFRGMESNVLVEGTRILVRARVDVEMNESGGGLLRILGN